MSYVAVPDSDRLVTVDADSTVALVDGRSGAVLTKERVGDADSDTVLSVEYHVLATPVKRIALRAVIDRPNSDDPRIWSGQIEIDNAKIVRLGGDTNLTATEDCKAFLAGSDGDDDVLDEEQKKVLDAKVADERRIAEKCLVKVAERTLLAPEFPDTVEEVSLWRMAPTNEPPKQQAAEQGACPAMAQSDDFPVRVREDSQTLDFSLLPESGDYDREFVRERLNRSDGEAGCFTEIELPEKRKVLVALGRAGQWSVGQLVCELAAGDRLTRCAGPRYAWNGSGQMYLSKQGRYLALASYGSAEERGWSVVDLNTFQLIEPAETPNNYTIGIAINEGSGTAMVAALVPGRRGAVQVWAYRIGAKPVPLARRVFDAPQGTPLGDPNERDLASDSTIFVQNDSFILATPFQQVYALGLTDFGTLPGWLADLWASLTGQRRTTQTISLVWTVNESGMPANTTVKHAYMPEGGFMAINSDKQIRLINTDNGRFLTPLVNLDTLKDCAAPIRRVDVRSQPNIVAYLAGCTATRIAPMPIGAMLSFGDRAKSFLGEGTAFDQRLPGEILAPAP